LPAHDPEERVLKNLCSYSGKRATNVGESTGMGETSGRPSIERPVDATSPLASTGYHRSARIAQKGLAL
jgi:hypothetical protein